MDRHTVTIPQANTDHDWRLVQAVIGLPACRVYHVWKIHGLPGLEAELLTREDANDDDETNGKADP